ncbi:hypothetical protein BX611_1335 [Lutibacter oceani]|uniref:Uncharacterized protein n=1 Tax=Lutibacter oceani TaxID=1853311 RepID=A0A3D9RQQ3_9FLAO|nr:hypothetical protein [Lutibacter oceani]REE81798.1 hypothetical protein BX611_1335 [Lutibacter oceani]
MKKLAIFLIFMVLGTEGLVAQEKKQHKNQLQEQVQPEGQPELQLQDQELYQFQDGTLVIALENGTTIEILMDQIQTKDQLKDQIKLQLQDGSCMDGTIDMLVDKIQLKTQAKLQEGSCLDSESILQQFLNLFGI